MRVAFLDGRERHNRYAAGIVNVMRLYPASKNGFGWTAKLQRYPIKYSIMWYQSIRRYYMRFYYVNLIGTRPMTMTWHSRCSLSTVTEAWKHVKTSVFILGRCARLLCLYKITMEQWFLSADIASLISDLPKNGSCKPLDFFYVCYKDIWATV